MLLYHVQNTFCFTTTYKMYIIVNINTYIKQLYIQILFQNTISMTHTYIITTGNEKDVICIVCRKSMTTRIDFWKVRRRTMTWAKR